MLKPIKRYVPAINPLAKTIYVRPTVTRTGIVRKASIRRPKFRHGITMGYRMM